MERGVYYGPWTYLLPSITLKRSYNHLLWPDIHLYMNRVDEYFCKWYIKNFIRCKGESGLRYKRWNGLHNWSNKLL